MELLLEKLSQYWQFRLLAVAAGVGLIVYAVVMPPRSDNKYDVSMATVSASQRVDDAPEMPTANPKPESGGEPTAGGMSWMGENQEAAAQLAQLAAAYDGVNLPRDFADSTRTLRRDAARGDVTAEFLLGHAYEDGLGVPKDLGEMAHWYVLARQAGGAVSAVALTGPGTAKDLTQAFDLYRQAADNGDAAAELYMGLRKDLSGDSSVNSTEAVRWYRKAAAQGSASAACNLGLLYHDGNGMPKDSVEAAAWFGRAAAQGSAIAQYALGRMYALGDGVERKPAAAVPLLEKAARQGNAPAQVMLSAMYAKGEGVLGSTARAYMWVNLAAAKETRARDSRDEVEKLIRPEEIAEGQRMTHDWIMENGRAGH
jgi:TPR repeat protein